MAKRSKTVDGIIRDMYARMAQAAAKKALAKIDGGLMGDAENCAGWAEQWYDRTGARASRWRGI